MEDPLATAAPPPRRPHRERRHRRKASDAATAALAAQAASSYGDVFGGPPRFAPPPAFAAGAGTAPADYAEVFGGVAASCSIPYLDLPPAVTNGDGAGAGGYGEIFGRFDFGDFAVPYEDMLPGAQSLVEEIASPSGSSRSSTRKESSELDAEPSVLDQRVPDAGFGTHFDDEQFHPVSFPPNGEQTFTMSYNKITRGRPDDLVEMTACIVMDSGRLLQFHPVSFPPNVYYVVDSCNLSNDSEMDHVPVMDSGTQANGAEEKMSPPNVAVSSLGSADSAHVVDQQQHIPTCPPISENICLDENDNKRSSTHSVSSEEAPSPDYPFLRVSDINVPATPIKVQHIPTCPPISENICQDENDNKRSSTHSVSSEEAPSPDYPFLRVSDINLPAAPIKVQPPPMPPSKLLSKKGSNENGDSDVNPNSVAAAAAMKEAMEFAEARLKAAKELMERKGSSFKLRKRPAHHRSLKPTEIKECNALEDVHLFEEKMNMKILAKEENQSNDIALLDTNTGSGALKRVHSDHVKKGTISTGKLQEMTQNGSELEQFGEWTSDSNFYELVSNDQICRTNEAECKGDNGLMTNFVAKLDRPENEKSGGFAGESKRFRKLWDTNSRTCLRTERVNQGKDDIGSVEVEQKTPRSPEVAEHVNQGKAGIDSVESEQRTPRSPEVTPCDGRVTYQEPTKRNNDLMANSSTKLDHSVKVKEGLIAGEPKRFRKLWGSTTVLRTEHLNLGKDGIAFVEAEEKEPRFTEVLPCDERAASQEATDSHSTQCPGVGNSLGHKNDAQFEISCVNNLPAEVHAGTEISSSFLEPCLSGGHANDNENHSERTAPETPLLGNSNQDVNSKEELELPCSIDGLPCTSARSQISQEHSIVTNADEIKEIEAKISKFEESNKSYLNFEEENLLSFVDESCLQNKHERANEVNSESSIHEKKKKFGIEEKADVHEDFQEGDMDQVAGSAEEEGYVTSGSGIANESEYEEAEADIFVGDMESNVTCGGFEQDPYQCQESHGSWGPQDLDNRTDRVSDTICHGKEGESKESLLENVDKTMAEVLNHDGREGQKSMENLDVCAKFNVSSDRDGNQFDSADELVTDDGSDYSMKMSTMSNNLQASFSEACSSMQHLSQKPDSVSAEKADEVFENLEVDEVLENLEVGCGEAGREIPTKNCTASEEGKNIGSEMEEREREDSISNVRSMDQQPFYLDSDIRPKAAEDTASETTLKSREENLNLQRTKVRNDVKDAEREVKKVVRLDEEKPKECKIGQEKEQDKERWIRELEEEKEREMERAKDRLAVQRATREAHERAFAEVRARAERIALERITSARQRASAEAREKEEKATAQAALEQASREARMKAERAAVVRATAEARERAIEKAKAAADAKERMGKFRSSFKDSFKVPNQDNQQEASFQKTAYNKHGKNMDSCAEVVEVESALRHKAKLERHQRTAERAAKALAEKNMRDMLVQREQAEKHRLAEFLDPEVKRWSNGKEGNLRALLSTLQYILGSDSGWQSVPLTDLITAAGVKKAYRKATLCVHPDKLQQRGATIRQKYICEKVFDLLKDAWNKYNSEER